jgi:hypothetical protein
MAPVTLALHGHETRMTCPGCHVGINIDTNRLANAAEEIHKAIAQPSSAARSFA